MMPCNLCSPVGENGRYNPLDAEGKLLKGIKQVGKTRNKPNGDVERVYRCLDCSARWMMLGNIYKPSSIHDVPVLEIINNDVSSS